MPYHLDWNIFKILSSHRVANFSIQDLQKRNNLSISKEDRRKSLVRCLFDFKKTIIRSAKRWLFRSTRSYFRACKVAEESISEGCTLGKICQWIQPRNSVNFPALGSGSGNNRNLFCPSTLAFFTIFLSSRHFSSRLPLHHFNHPSSFSFFFFFILYLLHTYFFLTSHRYNVRATSRIMHNGEEPPVFPSNLSFSFNSSLFIFLDLSRYALRIVM